MQNFTDFTDEQQKIIALELGYSDDIDTLITNDETFIPVDEWDEYAEQLFDELYLFDVPESVRYYIDYKAWANDLAFDYSEVEVDGIEYKTRSF